MFLRSFHVNAFRNLERQEVDLSPGVNLFVGENGQGKTNTLEAIHVLATLRSFRSTNLRDLINHHSSRAEIGGLVSKNKMPANLRVVLESSGRRIWLGNHSLRDAKEYLGQLAVVAFTPDDLGMIKGAPAGRRRFLDRAAFLFEPVHLHEVRAFGTSLRARNHLLKQPSNADSEVIQSFSQTLAISGAKVSRTRQLLAKRIGEVAGRILREFDPSQTEFRLVFVPGWSLNDSGGPAELLQQLDASLELDQRRKQTTFGPQHDDFDILLKGVSGRRFASQGQQRLMAIAVLLAVVQEVVVERGDRPVLLLDDVSSELDSFHRSRLFDRVLSMGGQVLVTATDETLIPDLKKTVERRFLVQKGKILRVGSCEA